MDSLKCRLSFNHHLRPLFYKDSKLSTIKNKIIKNQPRNFFFFSRDILSVAVDMDIRYSDKNYKKSRKSSCLSAVCF